MENVAIQLSEIQILPLKPQNNGLLGFASLVLNNQLYLGQIAIRSRPSGGIRLLYPTKKLANGKEVPLFHPICKSVGRKIELEIEAYWHALVLNSEELRYAE